MESNAVVVLLKAIYAIRDTPEIDRYTEHSFLRQNMTVILQAFVDCLTEIASQNQIRPNRLHYLAISGISIFLKDSIVANEENSLNAILSVLERKETTNLSLIRHHPTVALLACSIVYRSFRDESLWPYAIVNAYLIDAFGDRLWVDHEKAKPLVSNILTVLQPGEFNIGDKDYVMQSIIIENMNDQILAFVETWLHGYKTITEIKKRNGIKALCQLVSNIEVRGLVIGYIEEWLKEISTQKSAIELLMKLCINCKTDHDIDIAIARSLFAIYIYSPSNYMNAELLKALLNANDLNPMRAMDYYWSIEAKHIVDGSKFHSVVSKPSLIDVIRTVTQDNFGITIARIASLYLASDMPEKVSLITPILRKLYVALGGISWIESFVCSFLELMKEKRSIPNWASFTNVISIVINSYVYTLSGNANSRDCLEKASLIQAHALRFLKDSIIDIKWSYNEETNIYDTDLVECSFGTVSSRAYQDLVELILFRGTLENSLESHIRNLDDILTEKEKYKLLITKVNLIPLQESAVISLFHLPFSSPMKCELLLFMATVVVSFENNFEITNTEDFVKRCYELTQFSTESLLLEKKVTSSFSWEALYWKVTLAMICFGSKDKSLGTFLWEKSVNFKALVMIVITNQPFENLKFDGQNLFASGDEEKNEVIKFESAVLYKKYGEHPDVKPSNSYYLDKIVSSDQFSIFKKHISDASITFLARFFCDHNFVRQLLLSSKSPNYFEETIKAQGTSTSIQWLKNVAKRNIAILSHIGPLYIFEMISNEFELNPNLFHEIDVSQTQTLKMPSQDDKSFVLNLIKWLIEITLEGSQDQSFAVIFDAFSLIVQEESKSNVYAQQTLVFFLYSLMNYQLFGASKNLNQETIDWLDMCRDSLDEVNFFECWNFPFSWIMEYFMLHPSFDRLSNHVSDTVCEAIKVEFDYELSCNYIAYLLNFSAYHETVISILTERWDLRMYIKDRNGELHGKLLKILHQIGRDKVDKKWIDFDSSLLISSYQVELSRNKVIEYIEKGMLDMDEMKRLVDPEIALYFLKNCCFGNLNAPLIKFLFASAGLALTSGLYDNSSLMENVVRNLVFLKKNMLANDSEGDELEAPLLQEFVSILSRLDGIKVSQTIEKMIIDADDEKPDITSFIEEKLLNFDRIFDHNGILLVKSRPELDDCPPIVMEAILPLIGALNLKPERNVIRVSMRPSLLMDELTNLPENCKLFKFWRTIRQSTGKPRNEVPYRSPSHMLTESPWNEKINFLKSMRKEKMDSMIILDYLDGMVQKLSLLGYDFNGNAGKTSSFARMIGINVLDLAPMLNEELSVCDPDKYDAVIQKRASILSLVGRSCSRAERDLILAYFASDARDSSQLLLNCLMRYFKVTEIRDNQLSLNCLVNRSEISGVGEIPILMSDIVAKLFKVEEIPWHLSHSYRYLLHQAPTFLLTYMPELAICLWETSAQFEALAEFLRKDLHIIYVRFLSLLYKVYDLMSDPIFDESAKLICRAYLKLFSLVTYEYREYFGGLVRIFFEIFGGICKACPRRLFYFEEGRLEILFANLLSFYDDDYSLLDLAFKLGFSREKVKDKAGEAEFLGINHNNSSRVDQISSPRDVSKFLKDIEVQFAQISARKGPILCEFIESCLVSMTCVMGNPKLCSAQDFADCLGTMLRLLQSAFSGHRENHEYVDRWIQDYFQPLLRNPFSEQRTCILANFKSISQITVSPRLLKSLYEDLFMFHGDCGSICRDIFLDSLI